MNPRLFGTKAQTLSVLRGRVAHAAVPAFTFFSVERWRAARETVLGEVEAALGPGPLAVRSSAVGEDGAHDSQAGAFDSVLNVRGRGPLGAAIDAVVASYQGNPLDEVLVQQMVSDVAVSGVMTTHCVSDGAPYYEINYDDLSGRTDTVTGGIGVSKSVVIYRHAPLTYVTSPRVVRWLALARELEGLCEGLPLDVEFAEDRQGRLHLLQARRIGGQRRWERRVQREVSELLPQLANAVVQHFRPRAGVWGARAIFGEMPDWNPAEIIGTTPRPLAASLYCRLITDSVWAQARHQMGYRSVENVPLLVMFSGRPFIDVRASFNSFLPATVQEPLGTRLVNAWLDHLAEAPEKHDKVEFEVATTALDFSTPQVLAERYPGLLDTAQTQQYLGALRELTWRALTASGAEDTLASAGRAADALARRQQERRRRAFASSLEALDDVEGLLGETVELGTRPFAVAARHAFIVDGLLRSAVKRGALSAERLSLFRRSVRTVTGEMSEAVGRVIRRELRSEEFLERYGHLRPGTYDILSARYDQRPDYFQNAEHFVESAPVEFVLTSEEQRALERLFVEAFGAPLSAPAFLARARLAIAERERIKFVFTRHLSEVLEVLAAWGEREGLSRDDLSYVPVETMLAFRARPPSQTVAGELEELVREHRRQTVIARGLRLNYLVRDERDLYVAPLHRAAPNFVTSRQVEARTVYLDNSLETVPDVFGAIVCIENADPGFDWIFVRGIAGLVTRFGGSNSHMAIRCAEFDIPAAIGCGEQTFARVVRARRVDLNCAEKSVRPL